MKKWICLVLAAVLAAGMLVGCGKQKQLLGTWKCTVELSEAVQYMLSEAQLGGDFTVSDFTVTARLAFTKDGCFQLQLDQKQLSQQVEALLPKLEEGLISMLQSQLGEQQVEIPIEQLLTMSGLSEEALTQQLRQQFPKETLLEQLELHTTLSGSYKLEKNKLLLGPDEDSLNKDSYISCTLEEAVFTLTEQTGLDMFLEGNRILGKLPLVFTKE